MRRAILYYLLMFVVLVSCGDKPKRIVKTKTLESGVIVNIGVTYKSLYAIYSDRKSELTAVGYVSEKGVVVYPPQFRSASEFSNGHALIEGWDEKNKYIKMNGDLFIPDEYIGAVRYREKIASVSLDDTCRFFIDESGRRLSKSCFENFGTFSEGLCWVYRHGVWGCVNSEMKEVIGFGAIKNIASVKPFKNGLACVGVKIGQKIKYGYVDKNGDFVIKPIFRFATTFENGFAKVLTDGTEEFLINTNGKTLLLNIGDEVFGEEIEYGFKLVYKKDKDKLVQVGLVDENKKYVVPPKFENYVVYNFGICWFTVFDKERNVRFEALYDLKHERDIIINSQGARVTPIDSNVMRIRKIDKRGVEIRLVTYAGKLVHGPVYYPLNEFGKMNGNK